jgi:hypothetical protein
MAVRKSARKRVPRRPEVGVLWTRYKDDKSSQRAYQLLDWNHVNAAYARGSTIRQHVELMTTKATIPIPIESLCEELTGPALPRGGVLFGYLGTLLNDVADFFPNMYWWISEVGLNFKVLPPDVPELSAFDQLAGRLTVENWLNGRLENAAVLTIADALDDAGFRLRDELQPAQWKAIADHNQKFSRDAVTTFRGIASRSIFVRSIKKRLYTARERFLRSQSKKSPAS